MTSEISTSYISRMMMGYVNGTSGAKKVDETFSATAMEQAENAAKRISKENSAVTDFKRRNPSKTKDVDQMVNAGKKVLEMNGASEIDTTKMSMTEYKQHIAKILDSIPFDASRPYDEETIFISDAGWEQMKNDPEYEAWVIGYNKVNRSVPNPFAGMGVGAASSYAIEHFGASIDEHRGEGFSKTYGGTAASARNLYESKAKGGFMTKRGSQADAYPPKDYDIKRQQEKARQKRKKQQEELDAMFFQRRQTELWFAKKAQMEELFAASLGVMPGDISGVTSAPPSLAIASMAYESASIVM
ncbi:MAG: hypothetical protein IJP92_12045 [Lachnospiraceae bacterium]|nr:hypothetical protein [Lachnospiraceae bacterium]